MENTMDRDFILKRIADLLFEVGMLKKDPQDGLSIPWFRFRKCSRTLLSHYDYRTYTWDKRRS